MMNLTGTLKLALIMMVAFFVLKLLFGWLAQKYPNVVTTSANTVVQTA
jgi:hypothetical protein